MNRRLLDPFQSVELPEIIEEYLQHGVALCMAFNRRGTILASGTKEGHVVLWDFDTRGVASVLTGHDGAVTSVSWSRSGRHLLSGSEDRTVILWSVQDGAQVCRIPIGAVVCRVSLSPAPTRGGAAPPLGVVSVQEGPPLLLDLASGDKQQLPTAADGSEQAASRGPALGGLPSANLVGVFARRGEWVLVGQPRGSITVVDTAARRILDVVRVPNCSRVLDLVLNRKGSLLLATCQDQRVRMYDVAAAPAGGVAGGVEPPSDAQLAEALASKSVKSGSLLHGPDGGLLRPVREFQNAVDRTPWRTATFSADSEHVIGATAAKAQLQLYIWNRPLGNMERILEGPKEGVLDLAWHPQRSLLLSCSSSGRIFIWAKVHAENWSAFAPDFKELDENTEYVEREDEFDWNTPGAGGDLGLPAAGPDAAADPTTVTLDITTREREQAFSSDDEEDVREELLYLPVVIERELLPADSDDSEDADGDDNEHDRQGQGQQQQQQRGRQGPGRPPLPPGRAGTVQHADQAPQPGRATSGLQGNGSAAGTPRGWGGESGEGSGGPAGRGGSAGPEGEGMEVAGGGQAVAEQGEGGGAAAGGDTEMAEPGLEDDDGAGGGGPGRKRKVTFDEGALGR